MSSLKDLFLLAGVVVIVHQLEKIKNDRDSMDIVSVSLSL